MVDDWIAHTPKAILAKNFGWSLKRSEAANFITHADDLAGVDPSVFDKVPNPNPYILKANVSTETPPSPYGKLSGSAAYSYHLSQQQPKEVPGGGGTISIVDSRNFPAAKTIAAAVVTLKPGALRELHWHPNVWILSLLI